jgi:hypothetical protein
MFGNEAFKEIGRSLESEPEKIPTIWILDIHLVLVAATLRSLFKLLLIITKEN